MPHLVIQKIAFSARFDSMDKIEKFLKKLFNLPPISCIFDIDMLSYFYASHNKKTTYYSKTSRE